MGPNPVLPDPVLIVTVAAPAFVASTSDLAVTVTGVGLGTVAGAVYFPLASMVPQLVPMQPTPDTLQVTAGLAPLGVTVDANCWVPLGGTVALEGTMVTPGEE